VNQFEYTVGKQVRKDKEKTSNSNRERFLLRNNKFNSGCFERERRQKN